MIVPGNSEPELATVKVAKKLSLPRYLYRANTNFISAFLDECYDEDINYYRVLNRSTVIISNPDYVKHVLLGNYENYRKADFQQNVLTPIVGHGLLTAEGEDWRRARRTIQPSFQHQRLLGFTQVMSNAAAKMAEDWRARSGTGEAFDINAEMMAITVDIICQTMFGNDITDRLDEIRPAISTIIIELGRSPVAELTGLAKYFPRKMKPHVLAALEIVDSMIAEFIEARRAEGVTGGSNHGDLLTMLLTAQDSETGKFLDHQQLRDEIITIFMAGHETTANALTWAFYALSQRAAVYDQVIAESRALLGGRPAEFKDLENLEFNRMAFEEAMRLYPPVPGFLRQAIEADEIDGHKIRAGTEVVISPWIIHRHRKLWDQPEKFDPSRFATDAVAGRDKYAYMPFGGGPRICIGLTFAMMEAQIILATLSQHYRLSLVPENAGGYKVEPLSRITLRPHFPMMMTAEPVA